MIQLKTTVTDNYNNVYNVYIVNTYPLATIQIKGQIKSYIGGTWFIKDLLEKKSNRIYCDFGQPWRYLDGMHAVYNEIETQNKL